ncbi:MAG: QueT transporter family protein [Oscillospiraceae bacterium]|nr:QueT transporter family protein [Oscillospiraceae bacterium]
MIRRIALSGVIAAMYIALVYVNAAFAFGPVQFRAAEALTLLPFLFPAAIPGLFVGCAVSNFISQYGILDVVFGSAATLLAAILTAKCKNRWLAAAPPVVINALVIGILIALLDPAAAEYGSWAVPFFIASVGFGQLVVCYGLGVPLTYALEKAGFSKRLSINRGNK